MTEVTNSIMNRGTTRKPLEVLNLFSERNSETEAHQTKPGSDKSRIQLLNVCSTRKPYKCKFCPKLFSCSEKLEVHTKWHVKNPFQCRFCEHNFETVQGLTKHIQTHTDINLLVCDHCNKPQKCYSFNYRRKKPRRYSCKSCGRCFMLQSVLVTHLRRHIRQKTFVCKSCNMTFAYSAQFRWHRTNCKQYRKPSKKVLNKTPYLQNCSLFKINPGRRVDNVVLDQVGIDLDFGMNEDVKVKISNLPCMNQMPRYNDDTKTSDQFWNNREEESQGNTEVNFANQHLFDTEKDVKEDKSIISSVVNQERLSGDHNSKNSVGQIQNSKNSVYHRNLYSEFGNLPKTNESCLSNVNFPTFDLFQNDVNLRTSIVHYPETSGQEEPDLIGETLESTSKAQDLLKCHHCNRTFFFQESLDKHLKRYNKTKKHTCEYCGQAFTMASILNAHIRKHTGEMPFKCDLCEMSFTYLTQLHRHQKVCNISLQRLQAAEMAATDTISMTSESPIGTIKGSKSSNIGSNNSYNPGTSSMCRSLGEAELNNLAGMFYPTNSVPATSRHTAFEVLSPEQRLSTHFTTVKENENYDFNMARKAAAKTLLPQEENSLHCPKTTLNKNLHNNVGKINLTSLKSLKNPSPFSTLSAEPPEIHLQIPLQLSAYEVPNVAMVPLATIPSPAKSKSSKNNASKSNGNTEKRFLCRSCGKSFALAHNLKQHVRTHTGERPFKCDFCQARFSKSSILTVHLRRHTGEKPYGCKNCRRMFTHLTQLHRHLKVCRVTGSDGTYPADLSPSDTTRVISLGPNSFKKLTLPKPTTSFVNIDPNRTNQNGKGIGDKSIWKGNKDKDIYSVDNEANYAAKFAASSTSSAVDVTDFQPQLLQSNRNSNYPVVLDTQGNLYMKPEVNTFSC